MRLFGIHGHLTGYCFVGMLFVIYCVLCLCVKYLLQWLMHVSGCMMIITVLFPKCLLAVVVSQ